MQPLLACGAYDTLRHLAQLFALAASDSDLDYLSPAGLHDASKDQLCASTPRSIGTGVHLHAFERASTEASLAARAYSPWR